MDKVFFTATFGCRYNRGVYIPAFKSVAVGAWRNAYLTGESYCRRILLPDSDFCVPLYQGKGSICSAGRNDIAEDWNSSSSFMIGE